MSLRRPQLLVFLFSTMVVELVDEHHPLGLLYLYLVVGYHECLLEALAHRDLVLRRKSLFGQKHLVKHFIRLGDQLLTM